MSDQPCDALDHVFSAHLPTPDQSEKLIRIREAGKEFARLIEREVVASPDRTVAIRCVREAVMWANMAVTNNGISPR